MGRKKAEDIIPNIGEIKSMAHYVIFASSIANPARLLTSPAHGTVPSQLRHFQ